MAITRAGERTRNAILQQAAQLATVAGLEGLSIGHLATAAGMSKGGLYAHFGSKEELQLATVETARQIFVEDVMRPGLAAPRGLRRLLAVCDAFLSHVERRVFPGGCFFVVATAEVAARPGPVRDAVAQQQRQWLDLLQRLVGEAQELSEVPAEVDPAQLAFELEALLVAANSTFVLFGDAGAFNRARLAIRHRLGAAPAPRRARTR
jgi:AcrR family transcriptional regulator